MVDPLDPYRADGPGHDEMQRSSGRTRAAWAELTGLGVADRPAVHAEAAVALHDAGAGRRLDPLPVLVDEHEWEHLERAVRQRAELLDQILTDLYGERRLLTSGLLPPEVVLGHPGFLRAADGIRVPGRHQLFHTAADLARNADGAWTVLADSTDVPAGHGSAMADRLAVAQVLTDPLHRSGARPIGPYFHALRAALHAVGPATGGAEPRVALMTPGRTSPNAPDLAHLATALDIPLVEGGDLLVEEGRVWRTTLGRREPVDVLLRGVPGTASDPLELEPGSAVGVVGLLHAARGGGVAVVNPFGSAVVQTPALLTYLPRLSRALRGEELALASVATYWCGERSMCSHVIANLGRLVLRHVAGDERAVPGWTLNLAERADLAARIAARPAAWVGQEPVEASTVPVVAGGTLVPRELAVRTFAVSHGDSYLVMAGGLGQAGPPAQAAGAGPAATAKDVWVLGPERASVA